MSVTTLDNGVRVFTLGLGTVMTSEMSFPDEDFSRYIVFGGMDLKAGEMKAANLPPDTVLIEVFNARGALAYLRPLLGLLRTWTDTGAAPLAAQMESEVITLIDQLKEEEAQHEHPTKAPLS